MGYTKKSPPGNTKSRSSKNVLIMTTFAASKNYYILVNKQSISKAKKVPDIIREAYQSWYFILNYEFIF